MTTTSPDESSPAARGAPVVELSAAGSRGARDAAHAARGGLTQLLTAVAQLLNPVYQVVVARMFGQAVYGLYQTGLVVLDLGTRLGWMGGDRAMHRFIAAHRAAGEEELAQRAFGGALRLTLGASVIISAALAVAAPFIARLMHKPALAQMLPVLALLIVPATATMILIASTLGAKVMRVNLVVRGVGEPIMLLAAAFVAFKLGAGPIRLAAAHVTASAIGGIAAFVGTCIVFGRAWVFHALRLPRHPELLRFGLPVAGSEVGTTIVQKADLFILSFYVPDATIAIYAASEFLGRIAANVRYAFDSVAAPVLSEALHLGDRERLRYNLALMTRWVATLSVPLAMTMIGLRVDLLAIYGPGFVGGATVVCIWTTTHLVNGSLGLVSHVLTMSGRPRLYLANQLIAAGLNVGLSLLLIPRYGMTGAAVSALAAVTTPLVLALVEVWHFEHVHPFSFGLAKPFVAGAAMLATQLVLGRLIPSHVARVILAVTTGVVVYLCVLAALVPGREEREILSRLWLRLRKRAA